MKKQEGEMTFLDHLEVFRWHLIKSILAIVIMAVLAFVFKNFILIRSSLRQEILNSGRTECFASLQNCLTRLLCV